MNKIKIVCATCGSDDVHRAADVEWNQLGQYWQLVDIYDNATCENCGDECSLEEVEIK